MPEGVNALTEKVIACAFSVSNKLGTGFLEIVEDLPDIDVMIVPLGAGSEAAAAITTLRALRPGVTIIAVQAESSPAAHRSWSEKRICHAPNKTFAGGFATGKAYEVPFTIYKDRLDDFVLLKTNFSTGTTWGEGDFDGDNDVDLDDFVILKQNFATAAPAPVASTAEAVAEDQPTAERPLRMRARRRWQRRAVEPAADGESVLDVLAISPILPL